MADAYGLKKPKAIKAHKCCECGGEIQPGEVYHYHSGIWEGEPFSFKVCIDCDALRDAVVRDCDLHFDEVPAFGQLADDLEGLHLTQFHAIQVKRGITSAVIALTKPATPPTGAQK
jgi:hypothetical protein